VDHKDVKQREGDYILMLFPVPCGTTYEG